MNMNMKLHQHIHPPSTRMYQLYSPCSPPHPTDEPQITPSLLQPTILPVIQQRLNLVDHILWTPLTTLTGYILGMVFLYSYVASLGWIRREASYSKFSSLDARTRLARIALFVSPYRMGESVMAVNSRLGHWRK